MRDLDRLAAALTRHGEAEIVDELLRLVPCEKAIIYRLLPKPHALGVLE